MEQNGNWLNFSFSCPKFVLFALTLSSNLLCRPFGPSASLQCAIYLRHTGCYPFFIVPPIVFIVLLFDWKWDKQLFELQFLFSSFFQWWNSYFFRRWELSLNTQDIRCNVLRLFAHQTINNRTYMSFQLNLYIFVLLCVIDWSYPKMRTIFRKIWWNLRQLFKIMGHAADQRSFYTRFVSLRLSLTYWTWDRQNYKSKYLLFLIKK